MKSEDERETKPVTQLLIEAQSQLYALIFSMLGPRGEAYDVLQEANLAILAKQDDYDRSRDFMPWASRFAQMQVLAYLKTKRRSKLLFDEELVAIMAEEAVLERSDLRLNALRICIKRLTSTQQQILSLFYEQGRSHSDIARALGKQVQAIGSALYRIRKQLINCVEHRISTEVHE